MEHLLASKKIRSTDVLAFWREREGGLTPEAARSSTDDVPSREQNQPARVLIVAHRTAATPQLLAQVQSRAARSPCRFTLLVPRPLWDPDTEESALTLELAIPLLDEAAGGHVDGIVGESDPFHAVKAALEQQRFDEVIISTLPARVSHWLHIDLPARVQRLGLPVTVVTAKKADRQITAARAER
jgi:hypothetical protein